MNVRHIGTMVPTTHRQIGLVFWTLGNTSLYIPRRHQHRQLATGSTCSEPTPWSNGKTAEAPQYAQWINGKPRGN